MSHYCKHGMVEGRCPSPDHLSGILTLPANVTFHNFEAYRQGWVLGNYGEQVVGEPAPRRVGPSMTFYHFMNTGLLLSAIALIVAMAYCVFAQVP